MLYTSFSLNGAWEMDYQDEKYTGEKMPWKSGNLVENAVPGYWEDMTEEFLKQPFLGNLKINPLYGIQQYPISEFPPDMALPNIVGNFFYRREFVCNDISLPAVIHFEGVQNTVSVWLNDEFLARHEGYSAPFDVEIPDGLLINGTNVIVLSVSNHRQVGYNDEIVSGLTSRAANEFTGGITGDVELRVYNSTLRDVSVFISDDCKNVSVKIESVEKTPFVWSVFDGDTVLKTGKADGDFSFCASGLECWSPENPKLYTLKIECGGGDIERKFGVRRLLVDNVHFKLNGIPYYLRGICEHCYFPETIHPNHDYIYYKSIIREVKKLGFNFIRFHTYVPEEEYLKAADELGMLVHVESPNNTSVREWKEIVNLCRRHTSVVIYCCGNELSIDESFIEYLNECADIVHKNTDSLFSPLSALRGLEYCFDKNDNTVDTPFKHCPERFEKVGTFSDMYSSYTKGQNSYFSLDCNPDMVDSWSDVYKKPRVTHEICIDGTYTDLSLKDRYKGLRVGKTDMFTSIERHLEAKGLLNKAPLYFKNSSEWQRRIRKYCFESTRRSENLAGYDFLGPIDTHWHTFGYDVGMMNEFYELKPGESVRNVLMYNSPTVILNDLAKKVNFVAGEELSMGLYASHYGANDLDNARVNIRLIVDGNVIAREDITVANVKNGTVSKLCDFSHKLPDTKKPLALRLYVTLDDNETFAENEWELYVFPKENTDTEGLVVSSGMPADELKKELLLGKTVVLFGGEPFPTLPTTFRISLAGRTSGNLATVVYDHPVLNNMPHEGFCGWQFSELLEGGCAVCFNSDDVPFEPIIEVVSTHKFATRQAALFEFCVFGGKLLVCSFNFKETDAAGEWFKKQILEYAKSREFMPKNTIDEEQFNSMLKKDFSKAKGNSNLALNLNDITATRKNKK